jgi:hypothetical protein
VDAVPLNPKKGKKLFPKLKSRIQDCHFETPNRSEGCHDAIKTTTEADF